MTRAISTNVANAVASDVIRWALLLELNLDSGDVNVWSGAGDLSHDGKTWTGIGSMGSISGMGEASDLTDDRIQAVFQLTENTASALPDFIAEFSENDPVGRTFTLTLAFLNEDTTIDDTLVMTKGTIGAISFKDGDAPAISIELESQSAQLARSRFFRLSDQHQQTLFTGDKGLEFVSSLDEEILWGNAPGQKITRNGSSHDLREKNNVGHLPPVYR